jgi:hypothetical protein
MINRTPPRTTPLPLDSSAFVTLRLRALIVLLVISKPLWRATGNHAAFAGSESLGSVRAVTGQLPNNPTRGHPEPTGAKADPMRALYLLLAAGLVIGSFIPLAVYAKGTDPDGPTQAAIIALRTGAASLASSYGKAANSAQIMASYDDKLTGMSFKQVNTS